MLQLKPNDSYYQELVCTINERFKDWVFKDSILGVLFVITDQLTQKEHKVIVPKKYIVQSPRYWRIFQITTDGSALPTDQGLNIQSGGYYNYLCYAIDEIKIDIDITDPDKAHFVERGLLLFGEAQDYFTEYAEPLTNSIAYNGQ